MVCQAGAIMVALLPATLAGTTPAVGSHPLNRLEKANEKDEGD
jgi:hypothetical protein